jgi:hypothetical protein
MNANIYRERGTPDESVWPGVTSFDFWSDSFPQFSPLVIDRLLTDLRPDFVGLVDVSCFTRTLIERLPFTILYFSN